MLAIFRIVVGHAADTECEYSPTGNMYLNIIQTAPDKALSCRDSWHTVAIERGLKDHEAHECEKGIKLHRIMTQLSAVPSYALLGAVASISAGALPCISYTL